MQRRSVGTGARRDAFPALHTCAFRQDDDTDFGAVTWYINVMSTYRLLRLSPLHVPLMRKFHGLFGRAFEDPQTYETAPPTDAYLKQWLDRDHLIALAALNAETVIGGLVAYELDKLERARRELYIFDLAVEEPWRRKGVATGLIRLLTDLGKSRNVCSVYVQADKDDSPAIALYDKMGIGRDVLHFDLETPASGV